MKFASLANTPTLMVLYLFLGGCSSNPWLRSIEQLKLDLTVPREMTYPGEELLVSLELSNEGNQDVDICLGEPTFRLMGGGQVRGKAIPITDHLFCSERTTIKVGRTRSWEENVTILLESSGHALIHLTVDIINPANCESRYGCEHTLLHGQTEISILQR